LIFSSACFVYSSFFFAFPASRSSYVLFCGILCPSFVHPLFLLVAIFALVFCILLPVFNYAVAWLQLAASVSIFLLRLLSSFVCLCRICYPACVHLLTVLCQAFCVQSPEL
jgi:hypothetical protein